MKPFETDILKLRADELNYTLCMFVKEVRKPNGDPYASDSILYLTLGIQEYLFENGRIDNIFTDMYYEPFTSANHEVIKDFKLPINELGYFVTRIEGMCVCIIFMKKNSYCDEIEPFSQIVKEAFHCCLKLFKTCLEKRLWLWG